MNRIEYGMSCKKRHAYGMMKCIIEREKNNISDHKKTFVNHENAVEHQDENR